MDASAWHDPDIDAVVVTYRGVIDEASYRAVQEQMGFLIRRHAGAGVLVDSRGFLELPAPESEAQKAADRVLEIVPAPRGWAMVHADPAYFQQYVTALRAHGVRARRFGTDLQAARRWLADLRDPDRARDTHDDSLQGA